MAPRLSHLKLYVANFN